MSNTASAPAKPPQLAPELLAQLPGGLNPVDLWLNLYTAQQQWARIEDKEQRDNTIASTRLMLESLSDFPVERWLAFNHAIGWISAAVTAATWCKGAALAHCVSVWNGLKLVPPPEPGLGFAARLLNPALLPELAFTALVTAADNQLPAVALLIAARDEAPVMDMDNPENYARRLQSALSQMLVLRGGIPSEWITQVKAGAAQNAPAPIPQQPEKEPQHINGTIANMLRQRKEARDWSEDQIGAALSLSEGVEVSGFPYLKAFRFLLPGSARSVVADEHGRLLHVGREDYVYSDMLVQYEPAELLPMPDTHGGEPMLETIHVPLFGEFIDVWRPVRAQRLRDNVFQFARDQKYFSDEAVGVSYGPHMECEARRKGDDLMLVFKRDAGGRR